MRIYVISLQTSQSRRAEIEAQMRSVGLDYELFDAIDPRQGLRFFMGYREKEFLISTGREASPEEVACYASHLCLWRQSIEINEPILIMEDDAHLIKESFVSALRKTFLWIGEYGFIRLQTEGPRKPIRKVMVERAAGFDLYYCRSYPYGSMCYAIAPRVARTFVEASRMLTGPVDLFIKRFWIHRQPLFSLSPPGVTGSDLERESTIAGRDERQRNVGLRWQRVIDRLHTAVNRARFNRAYLSTHSRNP